MGSIGALGRLVICAISLVVMNLPSGGCGYGRGVVLLHARIDLVQGLVLVDGTGLVGLSVRSGDTSGASHTGGGGSWVCGVGSM